MQSFSIPRMTEGGAVKKLGYILLQWTWGLPQNLVGLAMFLLYFHREHSWYHGALVTVWDQETYCAGVGMFIFMSGTGELPAPAEKSEGYRQVLVHEYGHTVQSLLLGPLYLPLIWLPSFLWAMTPALRQYRQTRRMSYYDFFPERWANALGERITGDKSIGRPFLKI